MEGLDIVLPEKVKLQIACDEFCVVQTLFDKSGKQVFKIRIDEESGETVLVNEDGNYMVADEDGVLCPLDSRGIEVRSDDEDDNGTDLEGFVVDSEEDVDDDPDDEVAVVDADTYRKLPKEEREAIRQQEMKKEVKFLDTSLLVVGKRVRREPQRYVDPNYLKVICKDNEDTKALLGKTNYKTAKRMGLELSKTHSQKKRQAKKQKKQLQNVPEEATFEPQRLSDASSDGCEEPALFSCGPQACCMADLTPTATPTPTPTSSTVDEDDDDDDETDMGDDDEEDYEEDDDEEDDDEDDEEDSDEEFDGDDDEDEDDDEPLEFNSDADLDSE